MNTFGSQKTYRLLSEYVFSKNNKTTLFVVRQLIGITVRQQIGRMCMPTSKYELVNERLEVYQYCKDKNRIKYKIFKNYKIHIILYLSHSPSYASHLHQRKVRQEWYRKYKNHFHVTSHICPGRLQDSITVSQLKYFLIRNIKQN